ncbi:hypothetical protein [Gordonia sihwensis]|uniref:hypothetical protein n=1 Tax=Gordonia sihwensis TaxID=173559 RepID=UPI003D960B2F
MPHIENPTVEAITDLWDSSGEHPYPDLDMNNERAIRAEHSREGIKKTPSGYAQCYRCDRSASQFVGLRVSSLTPICVDHLEDISWGRDPRSSAGDISEVGPYAPR